NIWLVETEPLHVGQWGTNITTAEVSDTSATVVVTVTVDNDSRIDARVGVEPEIFELDANDRRIGPAVAGFATTELIIAAGGKATTEMRGVVRSPKLWGVPPRQKPNRYVAVTSVRQSGTVVDTYETPFGIRTIRFDANAGFFLNGEHTRLNG